MKSLVPLALLGLLALTALALPEGRRSEVAGPVLAGQAVTCDYPGGEYIARASTFLTEAVEAFTKAKAARATDGQEEAAPQS